MLVFSSFYAACTWVEVNANGPVGVVIQSAGRGPGIGTLTREVFYPNWVYARF